MAVQKFVKNMSIISALDDEPNEVDGLSAADLKAKFDEGGLAIQEYINTVLVPAVEKLQDSSSLEGYSTALSGLDAVIGGTTE